MTDGSSSLFVSVFLRLILDVEISYAEFLELLFAECTYFYRRIWSFQYHWYAHPTGPKWTIFNAYILGFGPFMRLLPSAKKTRAVEHSKVPQGQSAAPKEA